MSKMSVKKVTGVMILSLSFGVSAALMSPFGGVFAGRHGKNGKGTQGSSENVTVNRNSWGIFAQQALYVPLASELQSTVGNTVQNIVSEESQAPVITQNATLNLLQNMESDAVDYFRDMSFDDMYFDDMYFDDIQASPMATNANIVATSLYAQNVAAVAETPRQNFGLVPDVSDGFNNQIKNQAHNKKAKASKIKIKLPNEPRKKTVLTEAERTFKNDIAKIFDSPRSRVSKVQVIPWAERAIDSLKKQGFPIDPIKRKEKRRFGLFYKKYAPISKILLPEMKRVVDEGRVPRIPEKA